MAFIYQRWNYLKWGSTLLLTEEDMPSTGAQGKMVKETPAKKKAEGSQCKEIVKVRFRAVRV